MRPLFETLRTGEIGTSELQLILDTLPVAVSWSTIADGRIRFVNRAFKRLFGYAEDRFATVQDWLDHVYETRAERELISATRASMLEQAACSSVPEIGPVERRVRCADGTFRTTLNRQNLLLDIGIAITTFEDISDRKIAEERMRRMMLEDPLTRLPNRRALQARWQAEVSEIGPDEPALALVIADLDGFKPVNDCHGHHVGDEILIAIARRIEAAVRVSDLVCRVGGDEFVILLSGFDGIAEAGHLCDGIAGAFTTPFLCSVGMVAVGASLGASLYGRDGRDIEELLRAADTALYRRKNAGLGGWEWAGRSDAVTDPGTGAGTKIFRTRAPPRRRAR